MFPFSCKDHLEEIRVIFLRLHPLIHSPHSIETKRKAKALEEDFWLGKTHQDSKEKICLLSLQIVRKKRRKTLASHTTDVLIDRGGKHFFRLFTTGQIVLAFYHFYLRPCCLVVLIITNHERESLLIPFCAWP